MGLRVMRKVGDEREMMIYEKVGFWEKLEIGEFVSMCHILDKQILREVSHD